MSPVRFLPASPVALFALTLLVAAPLAPARAAPEPPPTPDTAPPRAALDGADLGARLAALGRLRAIGDDLDLAVTDLFERDGADAFRTWRALADTLADTARGLPRHRLVLIAHTPRRGAPTAALTEAQARAGALRDALVARGVPLTRISTTTRVGGAGGLDFEIRFERVVEPFALR